MIRVVAAALVLLATTATARAEDGADSEQDAEARVLYERGKAHYGRGEYYEAAGLFMSAYEHTPIPAFLYNAAQSFRLAGKCRTSATLYRDYLERVPDTESRVLVERHIEEMQTCADRQRANLERQADIATTEPPADEAPAGLEPRKHNTIDIGDGDARPSRRQTAGWITAGVGAGLLAASGIFVWDASRQSDRVSAVFERNGEWNQQAADVERRGKRSERLAWTTGVVGAGAVLAGAALVIWARHSGPKLSLGDGGAIAGWSWGF